LDGEAGRGIDLEELNLKIFNIIFLLYAFFPNISIVYQSSHLFFLGIGSGTVGE
jgi:hypothetical protein